MTAASTVTISFDVGYPLDVAAVDVQNRVSQAAPQLPAIVNQGGVTVQKKNPNFTLAINLYSPDGSVDLVTLSNYAYLQLVDPLKRIPGVGDVVIYGERRYSMRIWLDPDKLAKLGITAVDVQNAIAEQNVQVAAGKIGQEPAPPGTAFEVQVNALGRLNDPQQFGDIVVRAASGSDATVRLKDVARIELGALQYTSSAQINDKPSVFVAVMQLPGSNALELDKAVRAKVAALSTHFPKGIGYGIVYDTTMFVSASMHDVLITLGEALLLVIAVVFLFLQSWRATVIPGIAIPVSLIATLAVMMALGFSLNTVSMLGMVLAIGLVVDDAIVVVENVERQLEKGLQPHGGGQGRDAGGDGPDRRDDGRAHGGVRAGRLPSRHHRPALQPVRPDRGDLGRHLGLQFAQSQSRFERRAASPPRAGALSAIPPFQRGLRAHRHCLWQCGAAHHRRALAGSGTVRHRDRRSPTASMSGSRPAFLPVEDQGYFFAVIQLPDGASLQRTEQVADKVRKILAAEDGVQDVIPVTGFNFLTSTNQSNAAAEFAVLKPWHERTRTASEIVASVRPKLLGIPEAMALSFDPPSIPGIATTGGFEFQVEDLSGHGAQALNDATQALLAEARKQPELNAQALFTTFGTSTPQYNFDLDRTKTKLLGLNLPDVFNTLQIDLGSLYVNDFNLFGRTFRVTLQADKDARSDPSDLSRLYVRNAAGGMVPLDTLGQLRSTVGPEYVSHYNIYGSALINGSPAPGYSSSQAIAAMERAAAHALPADYGYEWTGITYQELKAGSVAAIVFALALVFVFLVLAAQYESWAMPFMVMLAVPLALFGAVSALWLRGMQIDVYSRDRFCHADRAGRQERDPDRRVRQAAARGGARHRRSSHGGRPAAAAPHLDDRLRLHPRRDAVDARLGRRRGEPPVDRNHRLWRHACRYPPEPRARARLLCGDRAPARRQAIARGTRRDTDMTSSRPRAIRVGEFDARDQDDPRTCGNGGRRGCCRLHCVQRRWRARREGAPGQANRQWPPDLPVPVVAVVKKSVPVYLDYVGTAEAIRTVTLQAKITGYLAARGAPTAPTCRRAISSIASIRATTRRRSIR